jgi:hypothetical protein
MEMGIVIVYPVDVPQVFTVPPSAPPLPSGVFGLVQAFPGSIHSVVMSASPSLLSTPSGDAPYDVAVVRFWKVATVRSDTSKVRIARAAFRARTVRRILGVSVRLPQIEFEVGGL